MARASVSRGWNVNLVSFGPFSREVARVNFFRRKHGGISTTGGLMDFV